MAWGYTEENLTAKDDVFLLRLVLQVLSGMYLQKTNHIKMLLCIRVRSYPFVIRSVPKDGNDGR